LVYDAGHGHLIERRRGIIRRCFQLVVLSPEVLRSKVKTLVLLLLSLEVVVGGIFFGYQTSQILRAFMSEGRPLIFILLPFLFAILRGLLAQLRRRLNDCR
jgi:hypothetical protein